MAVSLPPLFKHEHHVANPPKGVFGTLLRSTGITSENRLVLKPTQIPVERYEELGYDGLFGRYYRLADTYLMGDKASLSSTINTGIAFRLIGAVRLLFFENIKRTLLQEEIIPVNFEKVTLQTAEQVRRLPGLDESLLSELLLFLNILDLRYDIEMRKARRMVRDRNKPVKVGVAGGTRRRSTTNRNQTRRLH
jgi:hypothetical protein